MKKQIFKLTSILLAMVMVFSLFTIIPISAEGVDKATAVSNLKAAWEALEYNGYLTSVSHNYCNYNSANAWSPTWSIDPDAPDSENGPESKLNFVIDFTGKNDANNFYTVSAITNSARTGQIMPEYDLVGVNDIWFYYKTEANLPVMAQIQFYKNNGSANVNCSFTGWYPLPATNGEWVLYSFNKLITDNSTATFENRIKNYNSEAKNHPLIGQFGFNLYAPTNTKISLGDIFFEGDPNLADTYNFTDDDWIVKVVDTDLADLKSQYNDAEDSATWTEFVDAFNVVFDNFGADLAKNNALEDLKNAWQNLTFDGYADRISANYVGDKTLGVNYYNAEGPDEAPESVDNRKIPITAAGTYIYFNEFSSSGNFYYDATTSVPVKNIKDMYFYYKSTADITASFGAIGNNGAGSRQNSIFTEVFTLPSTNGEWVRYSFDQWLVDNGYSWNYIITQHYMKDSTQLACIGFASAKTASSTDLYLSELFVQTGVDTNLEGCDEWSDIELIWNASELSLSDYSDSADSKEVKAFNDALALAKELFAEEFAVEELRAAAGKMVESLTPIAYPGIDYSTGSLANISDYVSYTVDNAEYLTFGPAKTHAISVGASANRNFGVWLTGGMNGRATWTGDASTEDTYVSIYVKSIANPSATPAIKIYTRTMPGGSGMKEESGIYYLDGIEAGKTYKILLKDLLAVNNYTVADLAGSSLDMNFFSIQANGSDMELEVGSLITTNYYSPSDKVGADFIGEMATLDYSTYINTAEFEEKLAAALEVYPEVAANIAATKEVIDASKALDKIALKPNAYTFGDSLTVNNTVYGTSNKGDAFISFNNSVVGHSECNASLGVVEYNTDKPLTLADIEDLYFSYKAEGFKAAVGVEDGYVAARFYIYNEDFAFDTYTNDSDEEIKGCTAWDCRFGYTKNNQAYFRIDGNTGDEWVTTSIATIMGADWKTALLAVLNEADNVNGNPNWTDKTMEEVEISAIRLGFNNKYGTADVSLGSMYVDYVGDSDTAITASAADPEAVLEEARAIDLSSVNPVQANEFKKLVKALETKCIEFECNVTVKAGYIAGNWYESDITLKDLSVLSRYNDDKLDGTFCDVDAIGALTEETLRKQLLGIQ